MAIKYGKKSVPLEHSGVLIAGPPLSRLPNLHPSIWVIFKDCSSRESHCWKPQSHRCTNCLTGSIGPLRAIVPISYSTRDHVHRYAHDPNLSRCTACYLQHPLYPKRNLSLCMPPNLVQYFLDLNQPKAI